MNILQVNKFFHVRDGTSRYFLNILKLLEEKGHRVAFFSMRHPQNLPTAYSKYFVSNISYRENIFLNTFKILSRMFYSVEAQNQMKKLLDTLPVDIVHIHSIYHHISPSILLEIKRRNIPIVMTIHDYHLIAPNYLLFHNDNICEITKPDKYYKAIFHKCVKNSYMQSLAEVSEKYMHSIFGWERNLIDIFIAPTNFVRGKLIEYGIPGNKITILAHFIDYSKYQPSYSDKNYILYFGRLYEEKGLRFLLKVMEKLPFINCVIAGEGPEKKKLEKIIQHLKLKNIKILGFQKEKELISLICKSRFTVLPSKWYEGFGLTILESNVCGKPVVASRIGGIPEVIKDGATGFLFELGDVENCVSKIKKLWNNPYLVKKMGENARSYVEKRFNPEIHYKQLMNIYKKAIGENKRN